MNHFYFCATKTAWTSTLLPSCHGSNPAARAMPSTFSAKSASCSLFRSNMYLTHKQHKHAPQFKCKLSTTMQIIVEYVVNIKKLIYRSKYYEHYTAASMYCWGLCCDHGNKPSYNKKLSLGQLHDKYGVWCCNLSHHRAQLVHAALPHQPRGKQKQRSETWSAVISVVCSLGNKMLKAFCFRWRYYILYFC